MYEYFATHSYAVVVLERRGGVVAGFQGHGGKGVRIRIGGAPDSITNKLRPTALRKQKERRNST